MSAIRADDIPADAAPRQGRPARMTGIDAAFDPFSE